MYDNAPGFSIDAIYKKITIHWINWYSVNEEYEREYEADNDK